MLQPSSEVPWPSSEPGGAQSAMGNFLVQSSGQMSWEAPAPLLLLSFPLPPSHVSVSSLLHAMAVVPRADETILGAAPGSPFPGNILRTQMISSTYPPGHLLPAFQSILPSLSSETLTVVPVGRQSGMRL